MAGLPGAQAGDGWRRMHPLTPLLQGGLALIVIAGVLIGSQYADWAGLALGVAACGIGYLILRIVEKTSAKKKSFQPRMTRVLEDWE